MERCRAPSPARRTRTLAFGVVAALLVAGCGGGGGGYPSPDTTFEYLRADQQVVDTGESVRVEWSVRNPGQQDGRTFCRMEASYEPYAPTDDREVECSGNATYNLTFPDDSTAARFTLRYLDIWTEQWTQQSVLVPRPTRIEYLRADKAEAYAVDSVRLDWAVRNPGELDGRTFCRLEAAFEASDLAEEVEVECTGNASLDISFPEESTAMHFTLHALDNMTAGWTSTSATVNRTETTVHPWLHQFGTSLNDSGLAVAVDADGSIVVAGDTLGDLFAENQGYYDVFVAKYSYGGEELWSDQFGSAEYDHPHAVAIDDLGNVYVAGRTLGDLDGNALGSEDVFLRKYSSTGAVLWTRQFGTSESDIANDVALLSDGSVVVAGVSSGPIAGGDLDYRYRAFVRVYSPSGSAEWTEEILGYETYAEAMTVTVDGSDNIYVGGKYNASDYAAYSRDGFVTRLSPTGAEYWLRRFEGPGYDEISAVVLTGSGNVIVALDTWQIGLDESSRSAVIGLEPNGNLDWETTVFDSGIAWGTRGFTALALATDGAVLYATNPSEAGSSVPIIGALSQEGVELWSERLPVTTGFSDIGGLAAGHDASLVAVGSTDQSLMGTSNGGYDAFIWRRIP